MFSDTQMMTGMSVLLCGYTQLADGLSSYHWQMVVCLAWFSSLTHLATLTSLREYFCKRPMMARFRAVYMAVLLIMLVVSYGTTGWLPQLQYGRELSWPAKCLFSPANMNTVKASDPGLELPFNIPLVTASVAFQVVSYLTRLLRIFNMTARLAKKTLKVTPRKHMRKWYCKTARRAKLQRLRVNKILWSSIAFLIAVMYIIAKAVYNIGESMLWEVRCISD